MNQFTLLPIISGGHYTYQDTFVSDFLTYYPNPFALSKRTWETIIEFWHLDLSLTDTCGICSRLLLYLVCNSIKCNHPFQFIFRLYQQQFLDVSVSKGVIDFSHLCVAGDGTPVRTAARIRRRICNCKENEFINVIVSAYFSNLIVMAVGILLATVTLMAIIYTCLSLPIP